jgi:hypothetical protein
MDKPCIKCNKVLPLDEFYKGKTGLINRCKTCIKIYSTQYKRTNPHVVKKYYLNNKNELNLKSSEYYQNNKEKRNKYVREWSKHRYNTNTEYKTTKCIRSRITSALNAQLTGKYNSSFDLLGCDIEFYLKYLEAKFVKGMSWDNYGEQWHIDHIKPCASFDLSNEEEQRKCFNYTNTQPLWKSDNLGKGSKLTFIPK